MPETSIAIDPKTGRFQKGHKPVITPERNAKLSAALKGRAKSPEARLKVSIAKKNSAASRAATLALNARKKGVPLSEDHKRKISEGGRGRKWSASQREKTIAALKGQKRTPEQRARMSAAKKKTAVEEPEKYAHCRGPNAWNWRGGVGLFRKQLWKSDAYKSWRLAVMERDQYTCRHCQQHGGYLQADHSRPLTFILEDYGLTTIEQALGCSELWNIENGQTLCKSCHAKKTSSDMKEIRAKRKWHSTGVAKHGETYISGSLAFSTKKVESKHGPLKGLDRPVARTAVNAAHPRKPGRAKQRA